ncbi:MAG TPA: sulfite exporter TauE/SafE family protein [Blastocatellia bacterium]|nr:sulfite exporter TauE/SafE family protein [Blastocatellia bacterium]
MLTIKTWLFVAIGVVTVFYLWTWFSLTRRRQMTEPTAPRPLDLGIGFVTNFFDTLGIGSFATTTSMYKLLKRVRDEDIPGTLNVGHTVPVIAQAFIYIAIVEVDMTTLISLIGASVLGMWLGAGVVAKLPRRAIQIGMGVALLVAAALTLMTIYNKQAGGGEALGLRGASLVIGIIGSFILGSLLALGIGSYGPCLIMISLLGMNPIAAFPIMMGSAAFMLPTGSTRFIVKERYNLRAALGLALGGIPAVLLAAYIVRSLDLYYVRWLVVVVVVYTALSLLRSAWVERRSMRIQEADA